MGKNTLDGHRVGAVKNKSQTYNPKTDQYVKRGNNGKFVSTKTATKFKGVTLEPSAKKAISAKKVLKTKKN